MSNPQPGTLRLQAANLMRNRNYLEARKVLLECLQIDAHDTKALSALASVYISLILQGERTYLNDLRQASEQLLELEPETSKSYRIAGIYCIVLGKSDQATEYLQVAIDLDPEQAINWYCMSEAYLGPALKNQKKRLYYLEKALELDPANLRALEGMGILYSKYKKNWQRAKQYYHRALQVDPNDYRSLSGMAYVLYRLRNFEEAREHALLALRQRPESKHVLRLLCNIDAYKNPVYAWFIQLNLLGGWSYVLYIAILVVLAMVAQWALILYAAVFWGVRIAYLRRVKSWLKEVALKKEY